MLSIIYIVVSAGFLAGILCYPKVEKPLNGIKMAVPGILLTIFCQVCAVWLLDRMHIKVGLPAVFVVTTVCAALLWLGIWRKKKIQKLFLRWQDVLCLSVICLFVLLLSYHLFGMGLGLRYPGSTAAGYFSDTMQLVRDGELNGRYFSAFIRALFIEVLAPFLPKVLYFKAYVLADVCLHILEVCMFYVLILTASEKKIVRIAAPFFSIAYFFGYPAYNYMTANHAPWSDGVLICMLMIYAVLLLAKEKDYQNYGIGLLAIGALTYLSCGSVFALPFALQSRGQQVGGMTGIYASMYGDLVFFVPAVIYVLYYSLFRKKTGRVLCVIDIGMIVYTIVMYGSWYQGVISNDEYYKSYYLLWLLGWMTAALALDIAKRTEQLSEYFAYVGMIAVLAFIVLSNYDDRMADKNYMYDDKIVTKNFFSLYRWNADRLLEDYKVYEVSKDTLSVYDYVSGYDAQERIPILTGDTGTRLWYDTLLGKDSAQYDLSETGFLNILEALEANDVQMFTVRKGTGEYALYEQYFNACPAVFENDDAALYQKPGRTWMDAYDKGTDEYKSRLELYSYVKDELSGQAVPLMAREASYMDFIIYKDLTGNDSTAFYTWQRGELENILNLNDNGVQYIVLLKDDEYYKGNYMYYDKQDTVFENEIGKVVRCVGDVWSTVY